MTPQHPIVEQMALYTLVLLTGVVIHEALHYIAALSLGRKPQLTLTRKGPSVKLPDYTGYRDFTEIPSKRMKVDYALISLAPYLLLPLYIHLAQTTPEPGAKLAFATLASMHVASIITEFKQTTGAMGVASLATLATLYLLSS